MKLIINDRDIDITFKFRTELMFEDVMEHSFSGSSIKEWVTYMYCAVIANTEDGFIKYDDFLKWLDENMSVFYEFIEWYTNVQQSVLEMRTEDKKKELLEGKKKKVSKR